MTFTNDIFDRTEGEYLICEIDGILVPFFMEEYRYKNDTTALMKLEGVDSDTDAREFTNLDVYYPKEFFDEEELEEEYTWDYFVGFRVIDDEHGELGEITHVDETTINVLLQIEKDGEELLVPAVEEFINGIDHEHRILHVQLPEGLIDIDREGEIF